MLLTGTWEGQRATDKDHKDESELLIEEKLCMVLRTYVHSKGTSERFKVFSYKGLRININLFFLIFSNLENLFQETCT